MTDYGLLTIKLAVPLSEGGEEELAAVVDGRQEVALTLTRECFLHQAGAAGVVLGAKLQVFA